MAKSIIVNLMLYFVAEVRIYINNVVDYIFGFYWESKRQEIPAIEKENVIILESATSLAEKIRLKTLKSEDIVKACIERIKQVNPILNAVTDEQYEQAIQEARAVDEMIAAGLDEDTFKAKPYLGVPFTAKESFYVKGLVNSLGIKSRINLRAEEDAEVVRLVKEAGGILMAVTNVPEINRWQETNNKVFGLTCNPYDSTRTVGGSSGGEAALVSAAASPFGLGSDIGGSTRMPSFFCGLFGHYPTPGIINLRGATMRTAEKQDTMVSLGIICRHSEDLPPLMKILAGKDADKLNVSEEPFDIKKIKVYYIEKVDDIRVSPINRDLKSALIQVVEKLSEATGNEATHLEIPNLRYGSAIWRYWMYKEPTSFPSLLANNVGTVNGIVELFKKLIGMSEFTLASILSLLDEQILPLPPSEWAESTTQELREEIQGKLGLNGVLIFPSAPRCAPHHYTAYTRIWDFSYWSIWNALRFPATQVPLGLNSSGLPLGVQVVASPYNDGLAMKVAQYLEKEFGGYVPPCKVLS